VAWVEHTNVPWAAQVAITGWATLRKVRRTDETLLVAGIDGYWNLAVRARALQCPHRESQMNSGSCCINADHGTPATHRVGRPDFAFQARSFMISCPREQRLHRTRTTANAAATHFIHGYEMSSSGPSTVRGTKLREVYCGVIVRTMYVAAPIEAAHGASQGRILTQGFWQLHHRSRHWYAPAWELEQWRWRHLAHVNSANVRAGNCGLLL
jgi:hypothetical protein